jgi:ABC-type multidrug transport system fused ATPase/permease subunit
MNAHLRPSSDSLHLPITRAGLREAAWLFSYVLPYRIKLLGASACLLLASLAGLTLPYITGQLIDSAQHGPAAAATEGWPTGSFNINRVTLLLLAALTVYAVSTYFHSYWFAEVGERSLAGLRRELYGHLIDCPWNSLRGIASASW